MTDNSSDTSKQAEGDTSSQVQRPAPPSNIEIKTGTELPKEKK
jgi:hypothetical protein